MVCRTTGCGASNPRRRSDGCAAELAHGCRRSVRPLLLPAPAPACLVPARVDHQMVLLLLAATADAIGHDRGGAVQDWLHQRSLPCRARCHQPATFSSSSILATALRRHPCPPLHALTCCQVGNGSTQVLCQTRAVPPRGPLRTLPLLSLPTLPPSALQQGGSAGGGGAGLTPGKRQGEAQLGGAY